MKKIARGHVTVEKLDLFGLETVKSKIKKKKKKPEMSLFKKNDLIRAFYAADKDGDGALDLYEYVSMFHEQVAFFGCCKNAK